MGNKIVKFPVCYFNHVRILTKIVVTSLSPGKFKAYQKACYTLHLSFWGNLVELWMSQLTLCGIVLSFIGVRNWRFWPFKWMKREQYMYNIMKIMPFVNIFKVKLLDSET